MDVSDYIGMQFGKLTVLECVGVLEVQGETHRRTHYRCRCECGKEVIVSRHMLQGGRRTSCGDCTRIVEHEEYNEYVCENGESFLFDKEDMPYVTSERWHMNNNGYAVTCRNGTSEMFSRTILHLRDDQCVDHINGDRSDNRKANLRIASTQDNNHNMTIPSHNTSGYKGVSYYPPRGKYRAYIMMDGVRKHLGYFRDPKEAARAYDQAARLYFGEFACVNFPLSEEQGCRRSQSAELEKSA